MGHTISIGIPTLALKDRAVHIKACIESIVSQRDVVVRPVVIINGTQSDPDLRTALIADTRLRILVSNENGVGAARRLFRESVDTPYFGFIDDDDLFLDGAMLQRLTPFLEDSTLDAVLTDGWRQQTDGTRQLTPDFLIHPDDIVLAAVSAPILSANNHLFRTDAVGSDYIEPDREFYEWFILGARLAMTRRIKRIPTPTFVYRDWSSGQVTKTLRYCEARPKAIEDVLRLPLSTNARDYCIGKLADAYNQLACVYLQNGDWLDAWKSHGYCLRTPGGLRYASFTRRLLLPP